MVRDDLWVEGCLFVERHMVGDHALRGDEASAAARQAARCNAGTSMSALAMSVVPDRTKPVTASVTISGTEPFGLTITGVPGDSASI